MTITEDIVNSPALAISSGATTDTAAFTPPNAGCILVCFMMGDANNGSLNESLTASDSLAGTWSTPILDNARGGAAVAISWRAVPAGTAASMTVSVTDNKGSVAKGNYTRIFTGTDLTAPFGVTGVAGTAAISLVSTVANSWCWSAFLGSNAAQTAGANTTQKAEFAGFDSGDAVSVYASTNTTAGAGTTITLTEVGGTPVHHVAIELVPPGSGVQNGAVVFGAGAQLAAAGIVTENALAPFPAGANLALAGTRSAFPLATFSAGANLGLSGTVAEQGAVTFGAGAALSAAGVRSALPLASFSAGANLALAGIRSALVAAAFSAGAILSATVQAGLTPLTPTMLVAGGSVPPGLTAGGSSALGLSAGGALGAGLTAGGSSPAAMIANGSGTGTLSAGGV